MAQQDRATLKGYFNTGDTPTEAQFADLIDTAAEDAATATVYVSKDGNDTNDGTIQTLPKLTLASAMTQADALIVAGATGVRIEVLDGGSYTEASAFVVSENVFVSAPAATYTGPVTISANAGFEIDTHYAASNGNRMANRNFTSDGPSFYRANISDGRGSAGTITNTRNIANTAGADKNMFAEIGVLYVAQDGEGMEDDSSGSAGHIHFRIGDIYLAGNNAQGIRAGGATSNIIGYVDHILEIGTPTNTRGVHVLNAGAVVKVTAAEIIADTAYEVSAGDLYLNCQKITGTQTGTPTQLMIGTADADLVAAMEQDWRGQGSETLITATATFAGLGANVFTGTQDFNGQQVEGYLGKVVASVSGTLTAAAHAGNTLVSSGNITVPTTAGFQCVIIAGGAHTVTFNSTTSAAMAAGDLMTIVVEDATTIHAVLTASADKVSFT